MPRNYLAAFGLSLMLACCGGDMVVNGPVPTNGPSQQGDTGNYPKTDPMTSSGGSDVDSASSRSVTGPMGGGGASGGTITSTSTNWGGTGFSSPGAR